MFSAPNGDGDKIVKFGPHMDGEVDRLRALRETFAGIPGIHVPEVVEECAVRYGESWFPGVVMRASHPDASDLRSLLERGRLRVPPFQVGRTHVDLVNALFDRLKERHQRFDGNDFSEANVLLWPGGLAPIDMGLVTFKPGDPRQQAELESQRQSILRAVDKLRELSSSSAQ